MNLAFVKGVDMSKKILIVEDNPINLFLYKEMLEKSGRYEVVMSSDGRNIPELMRKEEPNLVILDIRLPFSNGIEIYQNLKTNFKKVLGKIPVMFVSADMSSGEVSEITGVPRDRCITKPFHFSSLLEKVDVLCQTLTKTNDVLTS